MLTGRRPFKVSTTEALQKLIVQVSYDIPLHMSAGAHSLIQQILMVDPTQKPTLKQILRHRGRARARPPQPALPASHSPNGLTPPIISIMFDMGYDSSKAWLSLANCQFDEAMVTYLLL
ncbi:hypothetical protein H1C71_023914 [Ictidomys tridecemlineatus]|nr:hypothetical protein H1C71_023914 [Ictidomys tridecemlineatus]